MAEITSLQTNRKGKTRVEKTMNTLFLICGLIAVICVVL